MTKRFIVETVEITDCDTDESRIAKVITDTNELYSYDDLYELCDDLNKLAEDITHLEEEIGARENDIKRLKRQVKTFKEDRDSNFKSAQYFREQLMKIPESIRSVWIE